MAGFDTSNHVTVDLYKRPTVLEEARLLGHIPSDGTGGQIEVYAGLSWLFVNASIKPAEGPAAVTLAGHKYMYGLTPTS